MPEFVFFQKFPSQRDSHSAHLTGTGTTIPPHLDVPTVAAEFEKLDIRTMWPELSFSEEEEALERWTSMEVLAEVIKFFDLIVHDR